MPLTLQTSRRLEHRAREAWVVTRLTWKRFQRIEGENWAGSFAFNAFFSLFPLMILFVTGASFFVEREVAAQAIVRYVEAYVPLDAEMQTRIFGAVSGVIEARERAGVVAVLLLIWTSLQSFTTLVRVTNRAWGEAAYSWWRLPLRGMLLLGVTACAVVLGMAAPAVASVARLWLFPASGVGSSWVYALWGFVIPLMVLFLSLSLFYRLAPRRRTRFSEVWVGAACATALLQLVESLFAVYLEHFATLNAVYGVFGGIMALLLWIYLSGLGFIFGACLTAVQAERRVGGASPLQDLPNFA